ncbi:MAG TPA: hypothetical protein VFQ05_12540 [Candidatus Eisenbacteria bacterium]|nr:hypothetical protein [Candidatus Eisenbacteria bacterium]
MSSSLLEPEPEPTESLDAAPSEPATVSHGFVIGWNIFRVMVWIMIAVWANPHFLDYVGGEGIARWLLHHRWVLWLAAPPLALLGLISVLELLNTPQQRAAHDKLARAMGATLVTRRGIDPTDGLPAGPGLRVPLGRWSMVVGTWKSDGHARTVAKVVLQTESGFSFAARGVDREPAVMRGLHPWALGHAMRQVAARTDDPRAAVAAAPFAYLAEPPITLGNDALDRAVVLRANHSDAARALLMSRTVTSAIGALNERTRRWDWTLCPTSTAGLAEMRLECPGTLNDVESLAPMQALMLAALEHLESKRVLAG